MFCCLGSGVCVFGEWDFGACAHERAAPASAFASSASFSKSVHRSRAATRAACGVLNVGAAVGARAAPVGKPNTAPGGDQRLNIRRGRLRGNPAFGDTRIAGKPKDLGEGRQ